MDFAPVQYSHFCIIRSPKLEPKDVFEENISPLRLSSASNIQSLNSLDGIDQGENFCLNERLSGKTSTSILSSEDNVKERFRERSKSCEDLIHSLGESLFSIAYRWIKQVDFDG